MSRVKTGPDAALIAAARAAMKRAYAPYSRFPVGAAVRGVSGRIYAGCNVENAAYPEGICAETAAIAAMVAAGETRLVEALVIGSAKTPLAPCGGCRQRLREFADGGAKVHMWGSGGKGRTATLRALLPESFGPDDLRSKRRRP